MFIRDIACNVLYGHGKYRDTGIYGYEHFVSDVAVQFTLAETDEIGNEIIEVIDSWNTADEPVKRFDLTCTVKPGETRYFQVFVDVPDGYSSEMIDWKDDPTCYGFLPLITMDERQQASDNFNEKFLGRESVHSLPINIYSFEDKEREILLKRIYGRDLFEEQTDEAYSMIKSDTPDTESLRAIADSLPRTEKVYINTQALETMPVTTLENNKDTTTTTVTAVPFNSSELPEPTLLGDTDCNGSVNISDAVLVMQSIVNPDKYKLSEQGKANADVDGNGITISDAIAIQEIAATGTYE